MKRNKAFEYVEAMVLANLKKGLAPWKKTWDADPVNFYTRNHYHGINLWILGLASAEQNVRSVWTTYLQAQQAGNPITHAAQGKGVTIVHSNWLFDEDLDMMKWHGLSFHTVFSVDFQQSPPPVEDTDALKPVPRVAQDVIDNMQNRPEIKTIYSSSYYLPAVDFINVPEVKHFDTAEDWVTTMFHELAHSTGHPSRLNRFDKGFLMPSKSEYAQEELIAEFAAAFLCATCDITQTIDNSSAYISGWKKPIEANPNCLIEAISRGQAAANYILGPDQAEEPTNEKEQHVS